MHPTRIAASFATIAGLSLLLAACGGESSADEPDETATPVGTPAVTRTATPDGGDESPTATPVDENEAPTATPTSTPEPTAGPAPEGSTEARTIEPNPNPATSDAILAEVRTAEHPEHDGWERFVFEFSGGQLPEAAIAYNEDPRQCGSGFEVELDGEAALGIRLRGTHAHDIETGEVSVNTTELEGPGGAILEGRQACDFEGQVEWALGLSGEQEFAVMTLGDPARLVIDVKQ